MLQMRGMPLWRVRFGLDPDLRSGGSQCRLWAARVGRPVDSDLDRFHNCERVFDFNAEIAHRAVHLRVARQKLDGAQVTGLAVDLCDLGPTHRMRSVGARLKPGRRNPVPNKASILTRGNVEPLVKAAGPEAFGADHQWIREPCRDRLASPLGDLEPNRFSRLALDDRCALLDMAGRVDVCDHELHQVAAAKLAVDGEIEESEVSDLVRNLETDTDCPNMLGEQWALLADDASLVPCRTAGKLAIVIAVSPIRRGPPHRQPDVGQPRIAL